MVDPLDSQTTERLSRSRLQNGCRHRWLLGGAGAAAGAGLVITAVLLLRTHSTELEPLPDAGQKYVQALELAGRGAGAEAEALLTQILSRDAANANALVLQGQLLWERGLSRDAFVSWSQVDDDAGRVSAVARYLEGSARLQQNRAADAEMLLSKAIELDDTYAPPAEALLDLFILQLRETEIRWSISMLERIRPLSLSELASHVLAGHLLRGREASLRQLRDYRQADSADVESLRAQARVHLLTGDYEAALALLDSMMEAGGGASTRALRAFALVNLQKFSAAAQVLEGLDCAEGGGRYCWLSRAALHEATGGPEAQAALLAGAVQESPFDVGLHHRIGLALSRCGRDELSAEFLDRAAHLDVLERDCFLILRSENRPPQLVGETVLEIGEQLLALNETRLAKTWLAQARSLVPQSPQLRELALRLQRAKPASSTAALDRAHALLPAVPKTIDNVRRLPQSADGREAEDSAGIRFADVASAAGVDFAYDNGAGGFKWIVESTGGGVGVLDYDLDGWPDLFFPQGGPLAETIAAGEARDRLFRNLGSGRFRDVTREAGLLAPGYSQGVAVGDVDNDGDPDLFVNNVGANVLYVNNADGTFLATSLETEDHLEAGSSAAFADFDADGNLDLYIVNYVQDWQRVCANSQGEYSTCVPHQYPAEQDRILRNLGDGRFEDVTETSGIVQSDGRGLGILIADLDADGRVDAYLANDGSPNFLFENVSEPGGIQFRERGLASGAAVGIDGRSEAGMGIAAGDFNADGRPDLFVTNFFQEPNRLSLNEGGLLFRDGTRAALLENPSLLQLGFGTQAADFDLDGDEDLIVANGDIDDYSEFGRPWKMPPQLFVNAGGRFEERGEDAGSYFQGRYLGRGVALTDFDRDLRPDVVFVHQDRPVALLRNDSLAQRTGMSFTLIGSESNRDAIGAVVQLRQADRTMLRSLNGGDGFYASNERRLWFGVDPVRPIDEVRVIWPSGRISTFTALSPGGRFIVAEESSGRDVLRPAADN